jgi:hypothetical protein
MPNITNIPAPRVPFIDERTGLVAREWYRFLYNQFNLTGGGETDVTLSDLELAPFSDAATEAQLTDVLSDVQGLELAPPVREQYVSGYGSFYDTTTQTAAAPNTAYAVTFNTTQANRGVYIGSPTSRIVCTSAGVYDFQFSVQVDNTSGGTHFIYLWARVNGVDVTQSAGYIRIKGNDNEIVPAWDFMLSMAPNDYFELMWAASDTAIQLVAVAAAAPVPAIPSAFLTVAQVSL